MPRVNPRNPSIGTGGSGVPIFEQPTPDVLIPQRTPTPWEFPTIPDWLKPSLPSQPTGAGQPNPTPDGGTYTSDQVEAGCSECESCPPEKLANGTCECGIHCGIDPDTGKPKPPSTGINCPAGYTSVFYEGGGGFWRCMPQAIIDEKLGNESCTTCDSAICKECDAWDTECEDLRIANGTCTPASPQNPKCDIGCWLTGGGCECGKEKGCECEACKNGTGECSDKKPCCNAWDVLCETGITGCSCSDCGEDECGMFDFGCKIGKWWEEYGTIVMIVGGVIVLGILLWLLRPLFGVAKNITEK